MSGMGNGERDNAVNGHSEDFVGDMLDQWADISKGRKLYEAWLKECLTYEEPGCLLNKHESILQEADRLVSPEGERTKHYGPPHQDFAKVTGMAKALWGRGPETPVEHAMYMILIKLARLSHSMKRDSLVDIAGYVKTIEMILEAENC